MLRRLPLIIAFGFASLPTFTTVADDSSVDFARDIRPILSDACFACHGPDQSHREAGLRFDLPGSDAIVPGNPEASEMLVRMLSDDPDSVMPPPHTGKPLKPESIELFRRWIAQGAAYVDHWAFTPPVKPPLPDVAGVDANAMANAGVDVAAWRRGPIDAFVLDRLARERLAPSPQADRATLLRRLHLDLTGLPPTPADVRRFTEDDSPNAYEDEVERLLDSVHFGERWGRVWLDAARYADSDGFEKDKPRFVWFYRDWVVRALNADMPYNDFITKQIAGDLLPEATQDDRVATGFLRNSMINEEGGVDPEQFRMEAMFDRMDAIGKSILGLTIQCAQCHSHKYDPISHQDYYALFAFINNCHEASITVFAPEEEAARRATLDRFDKIVSDRLANDGDWLPRLQAWEREIARAPVSDWTPTTLAFDAETIGGQKFLLQDDVSYIAAGYAPTKFHPTADAVVDSLGRITAVRVEMMVDPNLPHGGPGRSIDGTWALSEIELLVPKKDESGNERWQNVTFAGATATIDLPPSPLGARYHDKSDAVRTLGPVNFAIDGDHNTAWHGDRGPGRRNDPQTAMFVLAEPIEAETVTDENGETSARPIRFRVKLVQNHGGWNSDDNQTINLGRFRVSVTSDDVPAIPAQPPRVMATIQKPIHRRDEPESRRVIEAFIRQDAALGDLAAAIDEAWATHPAGTSQLVLAERPVPRETYRLERGDFLSPQEPIAPAIPSLLNPPMPGDAAADDRSAGPPTRLDFALWLASPRNPTTARSIVNRIWQEYFGTGITATSDDLGLQGEPPSHPELLDFLAADLVENGWSLKSLHRRIVLSETYRQDSTITPDRLETDPQNRLLSRGPRVRVPAEMVRDIALAASGLLNREVGGSPVYPPAPDFLFKPPASYGPKTWATSEGADRYRRSLYTFRFRSVPYPVLQAFDAPNGDVSCVRRSVSNTPLQALVTLNEPMFLECAKALADTAISTAAEPEADDDAAITSVFVSCTGRTPNGEELGVLRDLIAQQRERFSQSPEIARQLAGMAPETGDATEKAAWTVLARVVMNLDETITKP